MPRKKLSSVPVAYKAAEVFMDIGLNIRQRNRLMAVESSFYDTEGRVLYFYVLPALGGGEFLSDAGRSIAQLSKSMHNAMQWQALQALVRSYGVTVTEELALVETTTRHAITRAASMFAAMIVMDSLRRAQDIVTANSRRKMTGDSPKEKI